MFYAVDSFGTHLGLFMFASYAFVADKDKYLPDALDVSLRELEENDDAI